MNSLLEEIDAFLAEHPMSDGRFGMLSCKDGRLLERLRGKNKHGRAGRVWPEKEAEIRAFMAIRRRLAA